MKTGDIFKQIYQDLKEQIESENDKNFIKEYIIPSINYSENGNKDLYFISGIEMEIERILEQLEYKFYYSRYKDKYFFSNEKSIVQQKILSEIEKESPINTITERQRKIAKESR